MVEKVSPGLPLQESGNHFARRSYCDAIALAVIVTVVLATFYSIYQPQLRGHLPLSYDGDSLVVMAHVRAAEEGGMSPLFLPVRIQRLNAPAEAWWSDVPISKFVYWLPTLLTPFLGSVTGTSWYIAICLCLAGIAFYFTSIAMGAAAIPSATMGILFALLPYAFVRNLEHLTLTLYFVVPVFIYGAWSVWGDECAKISRPRLMTICIIVAIASLFNPYYWAMFLILVAFAGIGHLVNWSWRGAGICLLVGAVACCGFLIQNADTYMMRWTEGANRIAVSRDLWWLVKFGLYLPDLLLPTTHRLGWLEQLCGKDYHWKIPVPIQGESQTAYIGLVAGVFLLTLVLGGFIAASSSRRPSAPPLFWFALVIFGFAVVGGMNYLIGAFGFQMLRATNRYSIYLAAIGLYYGASLISRIRYPLATSGLCLGLVAVGLYDQIPKVPEWLLTQRAEAQKRFLMDREFFPKMESLLPKGAAVYELPRMPYPENGPINAMGDYEHFRPYLHTKTLRFSYGTVKGRQHALWQEALDQLPPDAFIKELQNRNFSAILINRRGYTDSGDATCAAFVKTGATECLRNSDFIILNIPKQPESNSNRPH